jgi:hypothetical protein
MLVVLLRFDLFVSLTLVFGLVFYILVVHFSPSLLTSIWDSIGLLEYDTLISNLSRVLRSQSWLPMLSFRNPEASPWVTFFQSPVNFG